MTTIHTNLGHLLRLYLFCTFSLFEQLKLRQMRTLGSEHSTARLPMLTPLEARREKRGYGKDSFLGQPFALLKSHMSFILYLCIIARREEWELRQAYRAPVEEGAR